MVYSNLLIRAGSLHGCSGAHRMWMRTARRCLYGGRMPTLSGDLESERRAFTHSRVRISQSVADGLVREIEDAINRDQLPAGHRIGTKQELCDQFGVAPATLGEAMRVLRARGLIEVRPGPGGGLFVAEQSPLIRLAHSVLALRQSGATIND